MKTTIAIDKNTAEKLTELARAKGVAKGVFIENMIEYFLDNNIDYSDQTHLKGIVRGEVERLIKIVRNQELTYMKPSAEKLTTIYDNINLAIAQTMDNDLTPGQQGGIEQVNQKLSNLISENHSIKAKSSAVCQIIGGLENRARTKRNTVEIEIDIELYTSLIKYKQELLSIL